MLELIENWKLTLWLVGLPLLLGIIGHFLFYKMVLKLTKSTKFSFDDSLVRHCYRPFQWIIVFLVIRVLIVASTFKEAADKLNHLLSLLVITSIAWLLIKSAYVLEDYIAGRFEVNVKDNLKARKIHTQFRVLKRLLIITVGIVAFATILMTFPKIKQLGTTILASAGIIGIVIGLAAQKTIGTFIAGLQIAFSQPIRVDDVVIVENEWGRIEEITLTYVVVKIWDQRRLIVPITYFIEKPFQNWTRVTADILGTVFLYVDYTVPFDSIRKELHRLLKESELWDGKVCVLQVTNTTDRTVELRALMSAPDASTAWTMRCEVREKLISFIQKKYPKALPRVRAEMEQLKPEPKPKSKPRTVRKTAKRKKV
jgi:small-conductance mechanosensitive channel